MVPERLKGILLEGDQLVELMLLVWLMMQNRCRVHNFLYHMVQTKTSQQMEELSTK